MYRLGDLMETQEMADARRAVAEYRAFMPGASTTAEAWRQQSARGNWALLRLVQAIDAAAAPDREEREPYRLGDLMEAYSGEWRIARMPTVGRRPEDYPVRCVLKGDPAVIVTASTPEDARDAIRLARR